jgi:murein L,D-transpeptidase YcbB/YkuD
MRNLSCGVLGVALALALASPALANAPSAGETKNTPEPVTAPTDATLPGPAPQNAAEEALGAEVRRRLAAPTPRLSEEDKRDRLALAAFLESRRDEPLWVPMTGLNTKATSAIGALKRAQDWGLDAADFVVPEIAAATESGPELPRDQLAEAEMRLSLALLRYARYARGGRITDPARQLSSYLDRLPQLREPKTVLEEIAAAPEPDAYLKGLHPKHAQFEKLRQKYLELLSAAASAPAVIKIPPGPQLKPGQKHPSVALLRKRLEVPSPAANADGTPADDSLYDETLAAAVRKFQEEKGIRPDGIVGAGTRATLNDNDPPSPAGILANMEEWRWMPDDLGDMYVWVNIPEFLIRVVKGGEVIHEERVITGLTDKQTPVFSDEMELVTFHPRWTVPDSIKVHELYPSLARGGNSFTRQNLRMSYNGRPVDPYEIDWSTADIRRFDVYQPSGGGNVLGVVKFSFPNKHAVYMHDTPTKGLFNETRRAFSHGCMRVRNPARLAEIVLAADKGWEAAKVAELIDAPADENEITLDRKIPVHITYFTAWVGPDGKLETADDVYGHEQRIRLALAGRFADIVRGPDHLAPVTYGAARYAASKNTSLEIFFNNLFGGF